MELPDKVYLNKFMIRPGMLHPAEFPPDNPEEEYIRKDSLLEWANNWEKIGVSDDFAYAIQTLIKHIESL